MSFYSGDRVYYTSGKHGVSRVNPLKGTELECVGTIDHVESTFSHVTVLWDNGAHNSYTNKDLALADGVDEPNPNLAFRIKKLTRRF